MRKAQDDALARTEAERVIGDELESSGVIDSNTHEPTEAGRRILAQIAKAVEFETITKRVGDEEIALRRLVITGPWEVDPARAGK